MIDFKTALLWTAAGRVRRSADPDTPAHRHPGKWEPRRVVFTASDYQHAHLLAIPAMVHNWSQYKHEAEAHAVYPATAGDLKEFAYMTDPGFRVLLSTEDAS